jgi:hypothetical protein
MLFCRLVIKKIGFAGISNGSKLSRKSRFLRVSQFVSVTIVEIAMALTKVVTEDRLCGVPSCRQTSPWSDRPAVLVVG